jgi:hypothetical protein
VLLLSIVVMTDIREGGVLDNDEAPDRDNNDIINNNNNNSNSNGQHAQQLDEVKQGRDDAPMVVEGGNEAAPVQNPGDAAKEKKGSSDNDNKDGVVVVYCICRKPADPVRAAMIQCIYCTEWFHFKCLNLSRGMASSLRQRGYKCPACVLSKASERKLRPKGGRRDKGNNKGKGE